MLLCRHSTIMCRQWLTDIDMCARHVGRPIPFNLETYNVALPLKGL